LPRRKGGGTPKRKPSPMAGNYREKRPFCFPLSEKKEGRGTRKGTLTITPIKKALEKRRNNTNGGVLKYRDTEGKGGEGNFLVRVQGGLFLSFEWPEKRGFT